MADHAATVLAELIAHSIDFKEELGVQSRNFAFHCRGQLRVNRNSWTIAETYLSTVTVSRKNS